jgi:hypothetical protein
MRVRSRTAASAGGVVGFAAGALRIQNATVTSSSAATASIARRVRFPLLKESERLNDKMTVPSTASSPHPLRVKELSPAEINAAMSNDPRLIIPVGTCEQHGPHMPLGCDTIIV